MIDIKLLENWEINPREYEKIEEYICNGYEIISPEINEILKVKYLCYDNIQDRENCIEAITVIYNKILQFSMNWGWLFLNYEDELYLPQIDQLFQKISTGVIDPENLKEYAIEFLYLCGRLIDDLFQQYGVETPNHLTELMKIESK